jgi:AraC family transcriptional regulator
LPANDQLMHASAMLAERDPPMLVARPSRMSDFAVARLQHKAGKSGTLIGAPRADSFGLTLFLSEFPAFELSVDGRTMRAPPAAAGRFQLHDLNVEVTAHIKARLDAIYFHIPRSALNSVAREGGIPSIETLDVRPGVSVLDEVVRELCISLLPSLQRIETASSLFMDHVGMALLAHLAQTYGRVARASRDPGSDLTAQQERRVEDMIIAHLDGTVSLNELACECNLSRMELVSAFQKTKGRAPHRWLLEQRVARACDLLRTGRVPLSDVAVLSGFADMHHFDDIFTRATGVSPDSWRRTHRS